MSRPCRVYIAAMSRPCNVHVAPMSRPRAPTLRLRRVHVASMSRPCRIHVASMSYPRRVHVASTSRPRRVYVAPMCLHVASISRPSRVHVRQCRVHVASMLRPRASTLRPRCVRVASILRPCGVHVPVAPLLRQSPVHLRATPRNILPQTTNGARRGPANFPGILLGNAWRIREQLKKSSGYRRICTGLPLGVHVASTLHPRCVYVPIACISTLPPSAFTPYQEWLQEQPAGE